MPVPASDRLADIVATGNIVVTVPWQIVGGDNEGLPATGTATYTIAVNPAAYALPNPILALCDDLDRISSNNLAILT